MILLDEPSMGLAPQIVEEIFEIVKDLNSKENVSFLLAEQNTKVALRYADFGYILENGRVVMEGDAHDLASNEDVKEFYLGVSAAGRKSFRDMKILPAPQTLAGLTQFTSARARTPRTSTYDEHAWRSARHDASRLRAGRLRRNTKIRHADHSTR